MLCTQHQVIRILQKINHRHHMRRYLGCRKMQKMHAETYRDVKMKNEIKQL